MAIGIQWCAKDLQRVHFAATTISCNIRFALTCDLTACIAIGWLGIQETRPTEEDQAAEDFEMKAAGRVELVALDAVSRVSSRLCHHQTRKRKSVQKSREVLRMCRRYYMGHSLFIVEAVLFAMTVVFKCLCVQTG